MRLLILGSTGLVGGHTLTAALAEPAVTAVIAPTRTPLSPHAKLLNPVVDRLDALLQDVPSWSLSAAVCALGTTKAKAGTLEKFRLIDYVFPLAYARACHTSGVEAFAVVSSIGSSASSLFTYSKVKGEMERDMKAINFRSLTILRPGMIGGDRGESRLAESLALGLAGLLKPVLPKKFHVNPALRIATVLLDSVLHPTPGCHTVYSQDMT